MSFGFGFGFPKNYIAALFSPAQLFTGSTNGVWYDPSDLNTLFQDAAGTLPVTSVEQPVGLMLDKSKGLVLGPELVTNGDFSNGTTGWTALFGASLSIQAGRLRITQGTASAYGQASQDISGLVVGKSYLLSCDVPFATGAVVLGYTGRNWSFGSGYSQRTIINATASTLTLYFSNDNSVPVGGYLEIDNISVRELAGNHAFNPSGNSANFPVLKQDESGRKYLNFNGTNQWLQTNSIDFTYGDKMFVCAGVRKIGTSISLPVELSANADTTAGTFNIGAPVAADLYYASLQGSSDLSAKQTPATFPSPITSVVQVSYALSQPSATDMSMRVNAVLQTLSVASGKPGPAGAGNFGNYPLYIGARAGSSLWFNGRLHQLVVAGKQASDSEIGQTEAFTNQKTGAY